MFNILLVDLLSKPNNQIFNLPECNGPLKTDHTFIYYMGHICNQPRLNSKGDSIRIPVQRFKDWLEGKALVRNIWVPSIQIKMDIRIKRVILPKICGDIAKHSFARLGGDVKIIVDVLKTNGKEIDEQHGYRILPEFYEWFHCNVLNYHGNTIAEYLNNIRWGIFDFLGPELSQSYQRADSQPIVYQFKYQMTVTIH